MKIFIYIMLAFITRKPLVGKSCTSNDNIGKKRLYSVGRDRSPRFSKHVYLKDRLCLRGFVNLRQAVYYSRKSGEDLGQICSTFQQRLVKFRFFPSHFFFHIKSMIAIWNIILRWDINILVSHNFFAWVVQGFEVSFDDWQRT